MRVSVPLALSTQAQYPFSSSSACLQGCCVATLPFPLLCPQGLSQSPMLDTWSALCLPTPDSVCPAMPGFLTETRQSLPCSPPLCLNRGTFPQSVSQLQDHLSQALTAQFHSRELQWEPVLKPCSVFPQGMVPTQQERGLSALAASLLPGPLAT